MTEPTGRDDAARSPTAPVAPPESIGPKLRRLRQKHGRSQADQAFILSQLSGSMLARNEISRWENEGRIITPFWLKYFAASFSVSEYELREAVIIARSKRRQIRELSNGELATTRSPFYDSLSTGDTADIGTVGVSHLDVTPTEFLGRITPNSPVPRRIGWSDVEHVRAITRAVASAENLHGGGLATEAGVSQLQWSGKLLEATGDHEVRRAAHEAVGNLSGVVAFSAFDIEDYRSADRCFKFALWCSDQGASWSLRANTLAEMARKSAYLGNIDEALSLIEFAQVRSDRVSATAQAMMSTIRARLLALLGRHREATSEVERADERFAERDPENDPPWLCYYDDAEHQGSTGRALIPVARDTHSIDLAAPRLEVAIRLHNAKYPRSRTFSRTRLAALMMAAGDPREALPIGRQALTDATSLRSKRIVSELHGLARAAERHARIHDVAELRNDIAALEPHSSEPRGVQQ